jgi:hypothetical protein
MGELDFKDYLLMGCFGAFLLASLKFYLVIDEKELENKRLKKHLIFVIKEHNKFNHENKKLESEISKIRKANGELLRYCPKSNVNRAILATPLPPLKVV